MNIEEQLKDKTKQLEDIGKEINQLQRTVNEDRELINQKSSEALKLDGAISVLKELNQPDKDRNN